MRLPDWKTFAGYLSVVAALALSLPGVQVVRAEEEVAVISVNLVDSGQTCDMGSEYRVSGSTKLILGDGFEPTDAPDPIALNTQGFSYRPPGVDPEARRLERR